MASEWVKTTLGDVLTLQRGFDLPKEKRQPGQFPVIASTGKVGTHNVAMVKGPGVVIGRSGSLGGGQFIKPDFWPLNTTLWVKDFKDNDSRYCYYLLKSLDLAGFNAGSGVPTLNRNHIHPLPVTVPVEVSEQRAIGRVLGTLEDKIELNRRMNQTLEAMARTIFKSWFVNFEPVRAMAEGRDTGLPTHLAKQFPDSLEALGAGEIPAGWRLAPLPEVVEVNPSRSLRKGDVAPYLDMGNIPTTSARAMNVYDREFGSGMRFMNGDTLVARITPCLENGKTCFVDFLEEGQVGWGSTEYIVLRPKHPLPPEYGYFLARTEKFRAFAISSMTGTSGRQRVPAASLSQFMMLVPSVNITQYFGTIAGTVITKMKANDDESRSLTALRDCLLPKLVTGELRVDDPERITGDTP